MKEYFINDSNTTTIILKAQEITKLTFDKNYYLYYLKNFGNSTIFINAFGTPVPDGDDTIAILPNNFGTSFHESNTNIVFLWALDDTTIEITGTNNKNINFRRKKRLWEWNLSDFDDKLLKELDNYTIKQLETTQKRR